MQIREAQLAEAAALVELSRTTFTETFGRNYPPQDLADFLATAYTETDYMRQIKDSEARVWVLVDREKLCGYITAGNCHLPHPSVEPTDGEVIRLYLLAAYQGNGWGSRLLETALEWLQSRKRKALWLGVWAENYGAQRLYQRYGFSYAGEYEFIVGNSRDRELIYRKVL